MKLNKILIAALLAPALLSMSSCGIYNKYHTPDSTPITAAYAEARAQGPDSLALGNLLWEDVFKDDMLADLIRQALVNNTSLRNAHSNVKIAQAALQGARLSYLPSLTFTPNTTGVAFKGDNLTWTNKLQLSANWEVDVFGKILNSKRNKEAALYQSEDYAQAVRSQIISGVANCFFAISNVKEQLKLLGNTAYLWSQSVQTMRDLKEAGRTTEAAVVQSEANYYSIKASITDLEVTLEQLYNTMSLLLNVMPQEWEVPAGLDLKLPAQLADGVPMSSLAFRPDVAAAEHSLAQAFYATNSARANFYPTINLTGALSYTNPHDWLYQLGAQLALPLFARGQNIANLKAAKERQQQALNNFEYALISAASEVENGLAAYYKAVEKDGWLDKQVADLEKSVDYTNDLLIYSNGTYLEVITAQQSLLSAQRAQLSNDLARSQAIINLYQSMGGGR